MNYLIKQVCFSLFGNYLRPSNNYRQVILTKMLFFDTDNLLRFTKLVKCIPEFQFFYCVLEKKNISSKIKRSKVTDYAALRGMHIVTFYQCLHCLLRYRQSVWTKIHCNSEISIFDPLKYVNYGWSYS